MRRRVPRKDDQLMALPGLLQTQAVFEHLRRYVESEAQLQEFLPTAIELEEQARQLAQGFTAVPSLSSTLSDVMPSKALAEEIVKIVSGLPAIGQDFDDLTKLGLARLLENL